MRQSDRLALAAVVAVVIVVALWFEVVSPKRSAVSALSAQVQQAQSTLAQSEQSLMSARASIAGYVRDVSTLKQLSSAVPIGDALPGLIRSLSAMSRSHHVDFQVIGVSGSPSSSSGGAAPSGAAPTAAGGAASGSTGSSGPSFNTVTFTFTFAGDYIDLQRFLHELDQQTRVKSGAVSANGRLLTITSVGLTASSTAKPGTATAAVTATAYVQSPASASTAGTGGATPRTTGG